MNAFSYVFRGFCYLLVVVPPIVVAGIAAHQPWWVIALTALPVVGGVLRSFVDKSSSLREADHKEKQVMRLKSGTALVERKFSPQ